MTFFEKAYLVSQYLIFATGIIYAVVAYRQLRAIRRQANIADETLKAIEQQASSNQLAAEAASKSVEVAKLALSIERPFVFMDAQTLTEQEHSWIKIDFTIVNHGKGVALLEPVRFKVLIIPGIEEAFFSYKWFNLRSKPTFAFNLGKRVFSPGASFSTWMRTTLAAEEWKPILSGKQRIGVLVRLGYRDVFGNYFVELIRLAYHPPGQADSPRKDIIELSAPDPRGKLYQISKPTKRHRENNKKRRLKIKASADPN